MRNTKVFISIGGTAILAVSIILLLVLTSQKPNNKKNGFDRKMLDNSVKLLVKKQVKEDLARICGSTKDHIFILAKDPRQIVVKDFRLNTIKTISIPFPINQRVLASYEVLIDSPNINVYFDNYSARRLYRFGDSAVVESKFETPLFTRVVELSENKTVLRAFDSSRRNQSFVVVNPHTGKILRNSELLKESTDGGFSSDGTLLFDKSTQSVVFVQYFENKFYCLDTNLILKFQANTIDTVSSNVVKTQQFAKRENGTLMPSVPLAPINENCFTDNGYLFVLSTLKADNELQSSFHQNTIIDIYDLSNGKYRGSTYIPSIPRTKIKAIETIYGNKIAILYDKEAALYSINIEE